MVVKIISSAVQKNRGGILLYCAGADGNTCGRKSRGDEKQLIDLEWPNNTFAYLQIQNTPVSQPVSDERHIYDIESHETDDVSSMVELESWYFGNIDSTLARTKCKKDGDFLVRYSIDKQRYIISYRFNDTCHHCIVQVSFKVPLNCVGVRWGI